MYWLYDEHLRIFIHHHHHHHYHLMPPTTTVPRNQTIFADIRTRKYIDRFHIPLKDKLQDDHISKVYQWNYDDPVESRTIYDAPSATPTTLSLQSEREKIERTKRYIRNTAREDIKQKMCALLNHIHNTDDEDRPFDTFESIRSYFSNCHGNDRVKQIQLWNLLFGLQTSQATNDAVNFERWFLNLVNMEYRHRQHFGKRTNRSGGLQGFIHTLYVTEKGAINRSLKTAFENGSGLKMNKNRAKTPRDEGSMTQPLVKKKRPKALPMFDPSVHLHKVVSDALPDSIVVDIAKVTSLIKSIKHALLTGSLSLEKAEALLAAASTASSAAITDFNGTAYQHDANAGPVSGVTASEEVTALDDADTTAATDVTDALDDEETTAGRIDGTSTFDDDTTAATDVTDALDDEETTAGRTDGTSTFEDDTTAATNGTDALEDEETAAGQTDSTSTFDDDTTAATDGTDALDDEETTAGPTDGTTLDDDYIQPSKDDNCSNNIHVLSDLIREVMSSYATKGNRLHGATCSKCDIKFVSKPPAGPTEYKPGESTPVYHCKNGCNYAVCGTCMDDTRGSRRRRWNTTQHDA